MSVEAYGPLRRPIPPLPHAVELTVFALVVAHAVYLAAS